MKIVLVEGSAAEKATLADLLRDHGIDVDTGDGNTMQLASAIATAHHTHPNISSSIHATGGSAFETEHFLARATAGLAESLDYETTLANVARLCVPFLADWCVVDMLEDGGRIARLVVTNADPAQTDLARQFKNRTPPPIDADHVVSSVIRTGQSDFTLEVTDDILTQTARDDEHLKFLRKIGICSHMIVPLKARGQTLGAITFVSTNPARRYGPAQLALAEELCSHAALAVDNARLYSEAQDAIKIRDEFLSVASHELRTPLTSLNMILQNLARSGRQDGPQALGNSRTVEKVESALSQTHRLTRIISELLDVSLIGADHLQINLGDVDIARLVCTVIDRFEDQIKVSGCEVCYSGPESVIGRLDEFRLDQVLTNLLSNALKYGCSNPIDICLEADDKRAWLTVEDRGIGIALENHERIFNPFERATNSSRYAGFGLGLYIARRFIHAMGGTIHVDSHPGAGARFIVELPLQREA